MQNEQLDNQEPQEELPQSRVRGSIGQEDSFGGKKGKIPFLLALAAIALGIWAISDFVNQKIGTNTTNNFEEFVAAELEDKCATPEGYTDAEWRDHMSHHPDRYRECLNSESSQIMNNYQNISPDDLAAMLKNKDFALIDTHIPEQAHIPGTDKFIPFNEIADRLDELPRDKNAKIVLYCRSGSMSEAAAKTLIDSGYTNVFNLEGGVNAWQDKGNKVENIAL